MLYMLTIIHEAKLL